MPTRRWLVSRICRTQVLIIGGFCMLGALHFRGRYKEDHSWQYDYDEESVLDPEYYTDEKDSVFMSDTFVVHYKPRQYKVQFKIYAPKHIYTELLSMNLTYDLPEAPKTLKRYPSCHAVCIGPKDGVSENIVPEGLCKTAFPYVHIGDNSNPSRGMRRADTTIPCMLAVRDSGLPGAGTGIFARVDVQPGTIFGPYEGVEIRGEFDEERLRYAWHIAQEKGGEDQTRYVDASDPASSNWLRYVNAARFFEEQNIYGMSDGERIWYIVFHPIAKDTELLTWYGPHYSESLGYRIRAGVDVDPGIAPYKAQMTCPECTDPTWVQE